MSEASQTIRQKVHALAEELPPGAFWDDVIEEARFRKAVEMGISAAVNRDAPCPVLSIGPAKLSRPSSVCRAPLLEEIAQSS